MALLITESQVTDLLTMSEAMDALEGAFLRQAHGDVLNQPRRRLHLPAGSYHTMVAGDLGLEMFGIKVYTAFPPRARFLVLLYHAQNGDLLALIEADRLGQMRTGAASGVATRHLTRSRRPIHVGIFGTGWQAESQLEAVCVACPVSEVIAYSRSQEKREAFCIRMSERLGIPVTATGQPQVAAENRDVVITATTAREPVLQGAWLTPGTHINAVGSNLLMKREIDDETIRRTNCIVVDSIEQSKLEAGDLLPPFERRLFRWEQVLELHEVVAGLKPGRSGEDDITLFKSNGLAMEDIAVAAVVYQKAREQGVGTETPLWQSPG